MSAVGEEKLKNMRRLRNCSVLFTLYVAVFCVWLRKTGCDKQANGWQLFIDKFAMGIREMRKYIVLLCGSCLFSFILNISARLSLLGGRCKA